MWNLPMVQEGTMYLGVEGGGGGCLDLRAARVSSSKSVRESSEQARPTAPLKSPSSNLAETRAATMVRRS